MTINNIIVTAKHDNDSKPATAWSDSDQAVRAVHSCNSWWLGPLWSDSVIKLVSVLFGKYTILVVTKFWPMETRLPCGDQWKAEKLGVFRRWPITRSFIKSDRAGVFIEHLINFRLNGEHWRAVQLQKRIIVLSSRAHFLAWLWLAKHRLYRKNPKNWDTWNNYHNCPTIGTVGFYSAVLCSKDANRMTNREDPDQTAPWGAVWSGSALFAQTYLSQYLKLLR